MVAETFKAGKVNELFANLEFLVQAPFFRQIANHANMFRFETFTKEQDLAGIGIDDLINDPD